MALSANLQKVLNNLWRYVPGLRKESEVTKLQLGNLLGSVEQVVVDVQVGLTLAAAATTAVTSSKALTTDSALAILTHANGGATVAKALAAAVSAAGTVTVTPDATPSDNTGRMTVIVLRSVTGVA
jgi:hypothetical protein